MRTNKDLWTPEHSVIKNMNTSNYKHTQTFRSWPVECAQWTTAPIRHCITGDGEEITSGWEKLPGQEEMKSGSSAHQLEEVSGARFEPWASQ